ncbi:hypothetical protein [Streptomyces sp. NRRL WC-3742]|uniref:hypothetical protein n=1 Tax=Streptomyces sp. NRRL WC-3742 TaxID=1463934 RepID=UPI0004C8EF5B|nr:hypothetical protein [Streptomyces sp. NRRL WC-3742]
MTTMRNPQNALGAPHPGNSLVNSAVNSAVDSRADSGPDSVHGSTLDPTPEKKSERIDDLQLAVDSLAAFPARGATGGSDVTERLAAVADLCRSVDAVLDSLVVQAAAEAAEEGWTAARMAAEHSGYYARLQRALLPAGGVGTGLTEQ